MSLSLLVTLLHRERRKRRKQRKSSEESYNYHHEQTVQVKTEKNNFEYDESICRVCLRQGDTPIYGEQDISNDLNLFAGLKVIQSDAYPKYLCHYCYDLLKGAMLLRETAQKTDQLLRQAVNSVSFEARSDVPLHYIKTEKICSYAPKTSLEKYDEDSETINRKQRIIKKSKESVEKKGFNCRKCDFNLDTIEKYNTHMSKYSACVMKKCHICNSIVKNLNQHMAVVHSEQRFMCDLCGQRYKNQTHLKYHRERHFNDNFPYKCTQCPYRGRYKNYIVSHMRIHTKEKPYQCELCPSRFSLMSNLNKHKFIHKTEFDYKCVECKKGFHRQNKLDQHIKIVHCGIKEHLCDSCDKAFGTKGLLMKHTLRAHKRPKGIIGRVPLYTKVYSDEKQGDGKARDFTGDVSKKADNIR